MSLAASEKTLSMWQAQKHCATTGSHVIPQRSTGVAQPSLTSVIGREPVLYRWYERSIRGGLLCGLCTRM